MTTSAMDEDTSTNDPAGAQAIDMPPGSAVFRTGTPPNISFASLQTKPSRGIASPAPDPPSAARGRSLPRRPTSRQALELPPEHMTVDGNVQVPKQWRSIGDFAAQMVKDAKGSLKRRMRRPKSTTTIATSPPPVETSPPPVGESSPPVEESSPEALRSDKPEENPPEPLPQVPLLDPQDKDEPVEDGEDKEEPVEDGEDKEEPVEDGEDGVLFRGRPPGAPQRSNVAAFFWSRLELAYSLFRERRLDECRELILWSLEKARVPLACRCQLLQQLAVIEPHDHGMECLEEADELCRQMRRIVPDSEQIDKMENRTSLFRGLLEERHKAIGEDEEMAEDDDITSDEDEEMIMDDDDAIEEDEEMIMDDDNDTKAGEESKESQSVQQQSDHEMEKEGLGEISKIGQLNIDDAAEDTLSSLPENALPRRRQTQRTSVRTLLGYVTPEASMREAEDADDEQADSQ